MAESILEGLGYKDRPGACAIVSMDSFYREFDEEERKMAFHNNFNFDGPKAFDFELLKETLEKMTQGHEVSIPVYNFATHSREKNARQLIAPVKVIIFEGILAFYDRDVVDMCDLKIFVDTGNESLSPDNLSLVVTRIVERWLILPTHVSFTSQYNETSFPIGE